MAFGSIKTQVFVIFKQLNVCGMLFITSSLQNHKKKPHKKEKRQVSTLPLALVAEKKTFGF